MKNLNTVHDTHCVYCFQVIKLPFGAFKIAFEKYPDAYLRVVQIVMIRLQRVGLHEELSLCDGKI